MINFNQNFIINKSKINIIIKSAIYEKLIIKIFFLNLIAFNFTIN